MEKANFRNIILTSNVLTPTHSLELELGSKFPVKIENPHCISPEQINISVLTNGIGGSPLEFTWKNRLSETMFVELGNTVIDLVENIKGGAILVIPSLPFLGLMKRFWNKANMFNKINMHKKVYMEVGNEKSNLKILKSFENNWEKSGAIFITIWR